MANLDSVLKSRDITLPEKVHLVKAMVFPIVMYGCENWTIKKLSAVYLMWTIVLEKTLESPLDSKEIQPVHPKGDQFWVFIGGTDLKLKFQYFGHLMQTSDSLEKTPMLGKIEGGRRSERQKTRWLDDITDPMDMVLGKLWELVMVGRPSVLQSMGRKESDTTEWLSELNWIP